MNLVGKIFVFLVLILSLVFMYSAVMVYATHRNWKEEIENKDTGWKARLAASVDEREKLKTQLSDTQARAALERASHTQALAKMETQNQVLAKSRDDLEKDKAALDKAENDALAELKVAQANLDRHVKEVEGLRKEIRDSQTAASEQFVKATQLADKLNTALAQLANLKDRSEQLASQVSEYRLALDKLGFKNGTLPSNTAPLIDGVITQVGREDLVEVSLGADDGIQVGHTLDVFHQNKYLGRVQVVKTESNKAVATVLKDYRQGVIQRGDRVITTKA